ncbi:MAG: CHAD domain-containing protein [Deltaproteobacteria bacterium]|nr:CHAD domain-containing protein [Deltaproteobacteria bacterium]
MQYGQKFDLDSGYDVQSLIKLISDQYAIKKGRKKFAGIVFYDTFDWRLFNKSLVLYESGKKLYLGKLSNREPLLSLHITSMPVFVWQLPENKLKEYLGPIIEMRALLKLVTLHSRSTTYSILNQDEKTVARLVHEEIRYSKREDSPVLSNHLLLQPVRGYTEYAQNIAGRLEESGIARGKEDDTFLKGMEVVGKRPGSYSTKIDIRLDPVMRSDDAVKVILHFLLGIIRINESMIEQDIDTEFVHDFRVAVRRTRSALGQIKCVFPSKITERFKKDFSFMGKLSNELRDLDVYLLKEDSYRAKLPPVLRDDIGTLFDYLREKRGKALQSLVQEMKSKRFRKILTDWEAFLNKPHQDTPGAINAGIPVVNLARKRIYKKYKSVVKAGNRILEDADEKKLHILRIHCKKLRYLMEFFSSLFHSSKINHGIRLLKKLQDNLGDFNDLRVQEEYLIEITKELPLNHKNTNKTLVAIGSLIGALERERGMIKTSSAETFMDFVSHENRDLFRKLFTSKTSTGA